MAESNQNKPGFSKKQVNPIPLSSLPELPFYKYQALGNDFILLDLSEVSIPDPSLLSRLLCTRRFGIGSDGLILVSPDPNYAGRMEFFNPDGSRAEMCGNGIRCTALFLKDIKGINKNKFFIATDTGPRGLAFLPGGVSVNLGIPLFSPEDLPTLLKTDQGQEVKLPEIGSALPAATCLSVGNPHCVLFVEDLDAFPVETTGPRIENLPVFPKRTNVIFASPSGKNRLCCRTWERGAGETKACGTGAAAAVVAATLRGLVDGAATVQLSGGNLDVTWNKTSGVSITGAAAMVFQGTIKVPRQNK